jgi:hypothetical protein
VSSAFIRLRGKSPGPVPTLAVNWSLVFTVRPPVLVFQVRNCRVPQVAFRYHFSDVFYDVIGVSNCVVSSGRRIGARRTGQGLGEVGCSIMETRKRLRHLWAHVETVESVTRSVRCPRRFSNLAAAKCKSKRVTALSRAVHPVTEFQCGNCHISLFTSLLFASLLFLQLLPLA